MDKHYGIGRQRFVFGGALQHLAPYGKKLFFLAHLKMSRETAK